MINLKKLAAPLLAAAFAIGAPMAANALSLTTSGVSGSSTCAVQGGIGAYQIDVLDGAFVNATFADGDAAGVLCFDLNNSSSKDAAVTLAVASVNQGYLSPAVNWYFEDGVSIFGVVNEAIAEGVGWSDSFTFLIGANSSVVFDWAWGAAHVNGTTTNSPQFEFNVAAALVPLPAGGLLLLSALGGLGIVRRRRKAA